MVQRSPKIENDILRFLQANGEPDPFGIDTAFQLLLRRDARMSHGTGMLDKRSDRSEAHRKRDRIRFLGDEINK